MTKTRISVPGFDVAKDTWGNVPNDKTMAAKYFLDIMNEGDPVMVDGVREILKAIWLRIAHPARDESSDEELGRAVTQYIRRVNRAAAATQASEPEGA